MSIKDIKLGDAVLFKGDNRILAKIIMYFTQSEYSHAGLVVGITNEDKVEIIESRMIRGVHYSRYTLNPKNHSVYRHSKCDEEIGISIAKRAFNMLGKPYDWKGVLYRSWLTITFRRRDPNKWNEKGAYYCSELVSELYNKEGLKFSSSIPVSNITPENIEQSKQTKRVF